MTADNSTETDTGSKANTSGRSRSYGEGIAVHLPVSWRIALGGVLGLGILRGSAGGKRAKTWKKDRDARGHKLFNLGELEMLDDPVIASTDGSPLELRLNGERTLRLEPAPDRSGMNIIAGHSSNAIDADVEGATISGGGFDDSDGTSRPNEVLADYGTVSGGRGNAVRNAHGTIGGGQDNVVGGTFTTTGGGSGNEASAFGATIGGGFNNTASGGDAPGDPGADTATIAGGRSNEVSDPQATVGGGRLNTASGTQSTVAGGQRNDASDTGATIGGGDHNEASGEFATIAGGGSRNVEEGNTASAAGATVGGGVDNAASDEYATVSGGFENAASVREATVGGGRNNEASNRRAAVGGGFRNTASGTDATVPGGSNNEASGTNATVSGGTNNDASGFASFAAGRRAKADHDGAYVWADDRSFDFTSNGVNTWSARTMGGARFVTAIDDSIPTAGVKLAAGGGSWSSLSDRSAKEDVEPVDPATVLERVTDLPITVWAYKSEADGIRHMGPMAREFHEAFDLGDEESITSVDADGVALAGIQGLSKKLDQKNERITALEDENDELREETDDLRDRYDELADRVDALEDRLVEAATD